MTRLSQLDLLCVLFNILLFVVQVKVAYISNNPLLMGAHAFPLVEVCWLM